MKCKRGEEGRWGGWWKRWGWGNDKEKGKGEGEVGKQEEWKDHPPQDQQSQRRSNNGRDGERKRQFKRIREGERGESDRRERSRERQVTEKLSGAGIMQEGVQKEGDIYVSTPDQWLMTLKAFSHLSVFRLRAFNPSPDKNTLAHWVWRVDFSVFLWNVPIWDLKNK